MGGFSSKMRLSACVGALVLAGAVSTSVGSASAGAAASVNGVAVCDTELGEQVITWTFHNFTNDYMDIQGATVDAVALTAGSSLDTTVAFSPSSNILSTAEAVGTSSASGNATGVLTLNVSAYQASIDSFINLTGTLTLTGACDAAPTTTTVAPTTAPATTLLGSGGGSLPASGNDDTLPFIALALVLVGGALLLVRRRGAAADSVTN